MQSRILFVSSQASKSFKAGDIIIKQGDNGHCAYIIEEGRVEIFLEIDGNNNQTHHVGTRGPGAIIGEMAILDHAPRTATIRALEECKLLEITREDFARRLQNADPVLKLAMQVILTRYRDILARADLPKAHTLQNAPPPQKAEDLEKSFTADVSAIEAIRIASDFETALKNNEVTLHYQPIIHLKNSKTVGVEALMRWHHPARGFISPAVFIPILEDTGLIVKASQWALKESLKALKNIQPYGNGDTPLFMSINFSSHDFASDGFTDTLYEALSQTDIQAQCVHLEITERLLIGQPETARDILNSCRKAGMSVSIDDFGTGYSSLSYLHYFPVDTIKIDRSFVMSMNGDPNALELVKSIIALGKNLKMSTIAEGVETAEEAAILKDLGCDMMQGYYFSKPLPENDIIAFLRDGN
ncbi:MAG: EAL domain-containing protein [Alphaproteobacteria bacterium]|nr:EAL domain-containing protein [Alphaproteobacteria bacterium]